MLPSIESFQKRLQYPKVCYIFYEFLFKAVMGEGRWKKNRKEANKRMGTGCAEAFTHALLSNNYWAWLLDYRISNSTGNSTCQIKTEYDLEDENDEANNQQWTDLCDELLPGIEITTTGEENDDYKLLHEDSLQEKEQELEFKTAKEDRQDMRSTIVEGLRQDKERQEQFKEHEDQLERLLSELSGDEKENSKKKRKCMRGLKVFTAGIKKPRNAPQSKSRKNRRDKGWSTEANKFMFDMTKAIQEDVGCGKHKRWENLYKEIVKSTQRARAADEEASDEEDEYEVDCNAVHEL